ncbi:unnamed protein product, partial [Ixodes hexagonus]
MLRLRPQVFWDPVHGQVSLHPVSVAIVDTPEFQRLRDIRQMGVAHYLYHGATHTRFEHSLGTAHLARRLGLHLHEAQPELHMTDRELLCLELAGLCHDLGHGPFSHLWERFYAMGASQRAVKPHWTHEETSCQLLKRIFDRLESTLSEWEQSWGQGLTREDLALVQSLILGTKEAEDPSRHFLFQVVNNKESSLDVDKWDYYLRDCHAMGLSCGFQFERLIGSARVIAARDGATHICFRDKELNTVYDMFRTRALLHRNVYQHRQAKVYDTMVCDALLLADEKITGLNGRPLCLWQTTHEVGRDPDDGRLEAFAALTDSWVQLLLRRNAGDHPQVAQAQKLWDALEARLHRPDGLYRHIGCLPFRPGALDSQEKVLGWLLSRLPAHLARCPRPEEFVIQLVRIHWGCEERDPVDRVLFYTKDQPGRALAARQLVTPTVPMLPANFQESCWHVLLRSAPTDDLREAVRLCL